MYQSLGVLKILKKERLKTNKNLSVKFGQLVAKLAGIMVLFYGKYVVF